ncbi:MAG: lysylphosphatidylglycerol synthase transmembrane domain-containing protein [Acidobacteriota bacterium]
MKTRASLVTLVVALSVMAVILSRLDWRAVVATWAGVVWPWVIAAAVINIANSWIEGLRWRTVLGASDVNVNASTTFWAMLVGTVGNVVLPFKLGEAARAWAVAKLSKSPMSTVASTVVLDRLVDLAALVLLLIVVPPLVGPVVGVTLPSPRTMLMVIGGAFLVLGLAAAAWRLVRRRRISNGSGGFGPHVEAFVKGLDALRQHHILAQAIAWAVASWCTRVAVVWVTLLAFGLHWPVAQAAMSLLIINLSIAVVGTPGNVGTFELAAAGALRLFGATPEVAMSYAVVLHLAEVVPTALLGALAIWKFGLRLQRPD